MDTREPQAYWVIVVSFLAAGWLALVPLHQGLVWWRPEWIVVVLVYWVIALPQRVGLVTALVLGLLLDVVEGAVLGQNMLALAVVAYIAGLLYQRLRLFNLLQQSLIVFVLVGINQLLCQWIQNLSGTGAPSAAFLLPAVTSALLWPPLLTLLRQMRRYFRVV